MSVTVVVTVLNEAETIGVLLDALLAQTRPADEIILVDGGSTDSTVIIAREYEQRLSGLRVLEAPGTNISQGRNQGIAVAGNPIIAVTDAGCQPAPKWLAQIVAPLETDPTVEWVIGAMLPYSFNHFEACVGVCSLADRIRMGEDSFHPSARSLAFRRKLWVRLGGFPEEGLEVGEDAHFISAAISVGAKLRVAPQATVRWRPRGNYRAVVRQFYRYAKGVARAGLSNRYYPRTLAQSAGGVTCFLLGLVLRHWLPWALLALLVGIYLARKARQCCFAVPGWRTYYRVPLILLAIHAGTMAGILHGYWRRLRGAKS